MYCLLKKKKPGQTDIQTEQNEQEWLRWIPAHPPGQCNGALSLRSFSWRLKRSIIFVLSTSELKWDFTRGGKLSGGNVFLVETGGFITGAAYRQTTAALGRHLELTAFY